MLVLKPGVLTFNPSHGVFFQDWTFAMQPGEVYLNQEETTRAQLEAVLAFLMATCHPDPDDRDASEQAQVEAQAALLRASSRIR